MSSSVTQYNSDGVNVIVSSYNFKVISLYCSSIAIFFLFLGEGEDEDEDEGEDEGEG